MTVTPVPPIVVGPWILVLIGVAIITQTVFWLWYNNEILTRRRQARHARESGGQPPVDYPSEE